MNRLLARTILLGLFAALASAAAAQAPTDAPTAEAGAESSAYQRAIEGALEEYRMQHFEEARALFEKAHAIDPNARTLRGLGMVEFERRHYVRAQELLEASLASTQKPLTRDQRAAVEELLARTHQFVSRFVVALRPPSAALEVEVDGRPVALADERSFAVEAGEHKLRFRAPGMRPHELTVDAIGGETRTLLVELVAKPSAATTATRAPAAPSRSVLGTTLTSLGGAVVAGGLVLGAVALRSAAESEPSPSPSADRARSIARATDITISVGVATIVAGVIVLLTKRRARLREREAVLLRAAARNVGVSF